MLKKYFSPFVSTSTIATLLIFGAFTAVFSTDIDQVQDSLVVDTAGQIDSSVDSIYQIVGIEIETLNSFADAKTHTPYEKSLFQFLEKLRFKTKESTIERYLLFKKGETVSHEKIIETERLLRSQKYLSDAKITMIPQGEGYIAHVKTSDNWTTTAALNVSKPGNEFFYNFGLIEYDLLGYGIEAGYVYYKGPERNSTILHFKDPQFIWTNHVLALNYMDNSDGHSFTAKFKKDFNSKSDQWGYTALWHNQVQDKFIYLPRTRETKWNTAQSPTQTSINLDNFKTGTIIGKYPQVYLDSASFRISRSFGTRVKNYLRLHHDRLTSLNSNPQQVTVKTKKCSDINSSSIPSKQDLLDNFCPDPITKQLDPRIGFAVDPSELPSLWSKRDAMIALSHIFQVVEYKQAKNLNSTKWTEDLDLGFSIENRLGRNIPELGARYWEWYFKHQLYFFEMLGSHHYFKGLGNIDYYVKDESNEVYHGSQLATLSYQYKKGKWSTILKSNYESFFLSDPSRVKQLGGYQGLTSFPDFYYVGQTVAWWQIEERFYPEWEVATAVPVPAVFLTGGNGWEHIDQVDFKDLEYAAGFGLRVGLSKSVLGIVNNVNLSWPLNGVRENGVKGAILTITAEANF